MTRSLSSLNFLRLNVGSRRMVSLRDFHRANAAAFRRMFYQEFGTAHIQESLSFLTLLARPILQQFPRSAFRATTIHGLLGCSLRNLSRRSGLVEHLHFNSREIL